MRNAWLGPLLLILTFSATARGITPQQAQDRAGALRAELGHHDDLYYRKAEPEITDAVYDRLKRELADLEQAFPAAAAATSPDKAIGDDRTGNFPVFRHRESMLSLEKSYSEVELRSFYARLVRQLGRGDVTCVVEPKFDGVAISVTYERGRLIRAVTRGNGVGGDDVTANVLTIRALPREMRRIAPDGSPNPIPDVVELRGEIYLPLAEFARINREREAAGEVPYAHPRNVAAGTLKQLDPEEVAGRGLAIVLYGWGAWEPAAMQPESQQEFHRRVNRWGLPGVGNYRTVRTADEMWTAVQAFGRDRRKLAYPVDGAVVKLDAVAGQRELGASDHAPHWAMAYKFPPERTESRVKVISLQVGRTGVLTPVAELAPVKLGGATVSRASLHNRAEIARLDIRAGDQVYLEKAGEIIPAIVGVNVARRPTESRPFVFPMVCPVCQTALVGEADESAVRCPNDGCPAQVRRRLQHFASAACVNIAGLGPATIDALVTRGGLKGLPGLYRLRREDLAKMGLGPGNSSDRLLAAIERSKQAELWRFIYGLGIPRVGSVAAKELARRFDGLEALMAAGASPDSTGIAGTDGLSPALASALATFFAEPQNRTVVSELIACGVRPGQVARRP